LSIKVSPRKPDSLVARNQRSRVSRNLESNPVEITFTIPHLFAPGVSPRENAEGLRVLLDALIAVNCWYLRSHSARPLYRSGVSYARTDDWECIPALYASGWHGTNQQGSRHPAKHGVFGDCKSLTAAYVAEQYMSGVECKPVFRFSPMPGGEQMFHILVWVLPSAANPKGRWEDPSAKLGMGRDELAWFGL